MQKKRLAITALLFWIFHPLLTIAQETSPPVTPPLVITEIAAFEPSETEWIEIYNKSETPIDATGWKFFEDETNHGLSAFRGDFLLDPNEYAVVANKADLVAQKYPEFTGTLFDSSWSSLKEEGEEIGIKDADGNFLERFLYPQTGSSTSLERIDINIPAAEPTNWIPHPSSNSMGRAREIPEILEPAEIGTTTEAGTSTETGTSTQLADASPETVILPPPPPPPAPPPSNQPPQAIIQIQSGSLIAQGETTINFDGRASFDPNGDRLNFFWDFGDGTTSDSANPGFHKYSVPGFYTVALTVTDPAGASGKNYQYVQVLNKPALQSPVPIASSSPAAPAPQYALPPPALTIPQFSLPTALPQGTMELRGYFVFVIPETLPQVPAKKQKLAPPQKKSQKKTKKAASKNPAYKNGDSSNDIKITEIFPYPAETSQEWIEVQNAGGKTVNLGNWMLADLKKTASPYLIPDSMNLKPGAYAVFKKGATRIGLNNDSDTVFLADFEGNVVDSISYADAKKDFSYALIRVTNESDLVASTQPIPLREGGENLWQWIDKPTPGDKNPVFEKIEGSVSRLMAGGDGGDDAALDIATSDGPKKIRFDEDTLDPLAAEVILRKGTDIEIQAEKAMDGSYTLKNIDEIRPAPEQSASSGAQKNSWVLWTAFGVLMISFLLNGIPLIAALKRWRASRGERLSETADFQKDETAKPETKPDQRRFF